MVYLMASIFGDVQYSQVMGHLPTPEEQGPCFCDVFFFVFSQKTRISAVKMELYPRKVLMYCTMDFTLQEWSLTKKSTELFLKPPEVRGLSLTCPHLFGGVLPPEKRY